ncbi:MAG TPA: His-Xaa-Ser system protein HxsD [Puia sp.]|nr:His-Xaa-Ser system protein HxsD [Puia sp.]
MKTSGFVRDGEIVVYVDTNLFSAEVVMKTVYWFGDKFHTSVYTEGGLHCITLRPAAQGTVKDEDLPGYLQKLQRDLIDFSLREAISRETHNIRDLLVAKAFSNGEFEESPPGVVSDPIGFDPAALQP